MRRLGQLLEHPVDVRSEVGCGSCFSVTVPRGSASLAEASHTRLKRLPEACHGRILLIDDQLSVARATRMLLELEGHEVLVASSVAEAEHLARDSQIPDIIVSDFHLSRETTGADAVRAIHKLAGRMIPAILVTGDTSSAIASVTEQLPSCHLLSKPVDADDLLGRIQQLLRPALAPTA